MHPFDRHLSEVLPRAGALRGWEPTDGAMPALYLGHGAPPLMEDALWMRQLFAWTESMPKPRAILIVSAHWEEAPTMLTSPQAGTDLVYDFWGFDRKYFQMRYDTPDATDLAAQVSALLPDRETLHATADRGLDHGAWVPLKVMYPLADVPVLQLSMPTHDPDRLLDLGRRLRTLREQGVLVIGSGYLTHGLPHLTRDVFTGAAPPPAWSQEFDHWAAEALGRRDVDALADYRGAPGMPYAHPTVEHYTPLFVTLGARLDEDAPIETAIDGYLMGLSKRSVQVA
ncbi:MAG: dioxygenase family protein [Nocardioidaceae bacterium]